MLQTSGTKLPEFCDTVTRGTGFPASRHVTYDTRHDKCHATTELQNTRVKKGRALPGKEEELKVWQR